MTTPKGVVAVITMNGHEMATATDFNEQYPGGYTVEEAQALRAKRRAYRYRR